MVKYCPTCNRSSDQVKFYGEFCEQCTRKRLAEKLPSLVEYIVCTRCGRLRVAGEYVSDTSYNMEQIINRAFKGFDVRLISYTEKEAIIEISDQEHGIEGLREQIALKKIKKICEKDYRMASGYYEAVLQLRGDQSKIAKMLDKVERYFSNNDQFISKIEDVDNGIDVYLSNKRLIAGFIFARKLKPTISFTLYGLKGGKKIYRNTYALHL